MSLRVGIVTKYHQTEMTWAALQLARHFQQQGQTVSLYARPQAARSICPYWDQRACRSNRISFARWALEQDRILWMDSPLDREVVFAYENGLETAVMSCWDSLTEENIPIMGAMDRLIVPYACMAQSMYRNFQQGSVLIHWDVAYPLIAPSPLRSPYQILVPLNGSQAQRCDFAVLSVLEQVLAAVPKASVLILAGKNWQRSAKRMLLKLQQQYPKRVQRIVSPNNQQMLNAFARSSLTFWPAEFEGLASVGLMSLHLGTPVVAWDVAPQNEIVRDGVNGVLLPCDQREASNGMRMAVSRGDVAVQGLISLLQDRTRLAKIKRLSHTGLAARREAYSRGWASLWD